MRRPVLTAMMTLAGDMPAVSVWDPFPILCPADPCRALDDRGRPQVFDADHLSGHGNDLLYPGLSDALLRGGAKPQPIVARGVAAAGPANPSRPRECRHIHRMCGEPDRLDARLPFRWPQGEIGKTPAFIIPVVSD